MDYYRLVPIYLNRWLEVRRMMRPGRTLLNVGCGKGAFNRALSDRFVRSIGVDINESDIKTAQRLVKDNNITFRKMDATKLQFSASSFDAVLCTEVLEHVPDPEAVVQNIHRVLKKGGQLVVTVPTREFPWTFDPINLLLQRFGKHLPIGAYACGHERLPTAAEIQSLLKRNGFHVRRTEYLSHHLMCLLELYHIGIWQSLVKENAQNIEKSSRKKSLIAYDYRKPPLLFIPRAIIWMDNLLFGWSKRSCNVAFDAVKR